MNTPNYNNLMDWHGTKMLKFIPKHFIKVVFNHDSKRGEVLAWLEQNAAGRFAIEQKIEKPVGAGAFFANEKFFIGFENAPDATMYTMFYR